ncbi:hypothetical protein [Maricaulis parjimensis]|uniref:hypothetical protein n=1 Tax=Maricaulis parjimensis TaxID=144023 RepID=UPI00193A2110|nr:hypothetical protein [Maricaulis parjimensis]
MFEPVLFPARFTGLACLAGLALSATAPALSQQPDPGFSIFAPQPEEETEETVDAPETELSPSLTQTAGAWLDRDAYLALRGERSTDVLRTRWQIETSALDGTALGREQREIVIGDGYASEPASEGRTVFDFATDRILTRTALLEGPAVLNAPIVAHVHRQVSTFSYFTQNGELDEVTGPGGSQFERFWIEAAMGVRLSEADMHVTENEDGHVAIRRFEMGSEIFGYDPGESDTSQAAALFQAWMRHALPIHPDALHALPEDGGIPERFSFLVFSPSSPDGRRETWTRLSLNPGEGAFPWPENIPSAPAEAYETGHPAITRLLAAGFDALNQPAAAATTDATLVAASEAAQNRADFAGAYLALYQIAQHAGPCRNGSDSPACARMSQVTAAGLGNADFEALMNALSNMQDDRERALAYLRSQTHRQGFAGAAINMLAAQSIAAQQAATPGALPDLSPLDFFAASAEADPFAPLTYWHAGRYAAARDDIESAWMLFEIARRLPDADRLPPLREASAMQEQLQSLAPDFFGPAAAN